jgi:hypothetical protein
MVRRESRDPLTVKLRITIALLLGHFLPKSTRGFGSCCLLAALLLSLLLEFPSLTGFRALFSPARLVQFEQCDTELAILRIFLDWNARLCNVRGYSAGHIVTDRVRLVIVEH